ncbi:MAG: EamA family transporter [bacterium]|nr:EamA family transporter [bacterium]
MPSFTQQPSRLTVGATAALLILIWGTTWAAIRISLEGFPPLTGVAIRFALAGFVLATAALVAGVRLGGTRREVTLWMVQALLTFGICYGIVYWAEQWVPSGLTSVLFSTFSLFMALWAYLLLPEERLAPVGFLGVLIGFGGVAVIFSEDLSRLGDPRVATASFVLLLSPCGASFAQAVVKRWGKGIHSLTLTAVPMVIAAMMMGGVAALVESDRAIVLAPGPIAATLYLALFGSAVTFSLYFWLLHHVKATQLGLIAFGIPVVAVAVGTFALDEPVTARMLMGSALVVVGVVFAMRPAKPVAP